MVVLHYYLENGVSGRRLMQKLDELHGLSHDIFSLRAEVCYNVELNRDINDKERCQLIWLLSSASYEGQLREETFISDVNGGTLIEIGPRLNFSTPFSSNAVSICNSMGLTCVKRLEKSIRYLVSSKHKEIREDPQLLQKVVSFLHDEMTECVYQSPLTSFDHGIVPENWFVVDILSLGKEALKDVNDKLGLAFDDWDLDFYYRLFKEKLQRNPTSVECFDLAQSNSEHSRHWFFKGVMIVSGIEKPQSLFDMIIETQNNSNPNNVIKFSDNSSAITGFEVNKILPKLTDEPSNYISCRSNSHIIFTAETHNFPTGVAPFSGATTGTGGRIRDVQAVGRGGHCIAGTAGYSVGNLYIPGYKQPWENESYSYPSNLAKPLKILIEASNGASDYGNKFGEPVICGFTRSFGLEDNFGNRREWIKPIMFSGGVGAMEASMVNKFYPEKGMLLTKVGGPVYRIGVGGGSASSIQVHGDNRSELDFNAVQRGDPEMENKMNRIIRACIEEGQKNPICSIHDQGAGGNGNVLKELVEPEGAVIYTNAFTLGDKSISTLELWGAEYQESNAILIRPENKEKLQKLAQRERCSIDFVGTVTGNGKVILSEENNYNLNKYSNCDVSSTGKPFNLDLELILGKMPRKKFTLQIQETPKKPLILEPNVDITYALSRVLRLVTVGSKRFLTNKVDRCVTGLIAQQQCVGPLETPVADCAITALSMFNTEGVATAIGEQPLKGLISPRAGARMTVAEALTNLMFAKISCLGDVKCSGNWMWAAKVPSEGGTLYKTCKAMCQFMSELGIAVDGGKDSLSMAARVGNETVIAPGTLVVSVYAPCPDIRVKVTPDIKSPRIKRNGALLWISLSEERRLGGSALAQCFSQLGSEVPTVESASLLKSGFNITQNLIADGKILSGHDISDGGLITCVLEMAFAGISSLDLKIDTRIQGQPDPLKVLFAEEVGWVIEVDPNDVDHVKELYQSAHLICEYIGTSKNCGAGSQISIQDHEGCVLVDERLGELMKWWEETSYRLECMQATKVVVREEFHNLHKRNGPSYRLLFNPDDIDIERQVLSQAPRVAVIREEGTNGDREMAASLYMVGFETWDVTMQDLLDKKVTTDYFRGVVFPGGFSYGDVLGSAKGWAASLTFNERLQTQFEAFRKRDDTWSLGVCNGCQLMCLLGWVGSKTDHESDARPKPGVVLGPNKSERFECRFSNVQIENSPSIMCKGMHQSALGIWIAHGEGQFKFLDEDSLNYSVALRYVDEDGMPTEKYPFNPNGSKGGIAGICSLDGRHLAMMPHPERCTLMWQWPYVPPNWHLKVSPWLKLFQNAYKWSIQF